MKKIIIHGATSFLGSNFIKRLLQRKDIDIIIFVRNRSNVSFLVDSSVKIYFYNESILELLQDENLQSDICEGGIFYDFAWYGVYNEFRNSIEQFLINIPMTINSINLANKLNVNHWVGFGSQAEYGVVDNIITEGTFCNPTTLYGKAKLICSKIAQEICNTCGIEFSWLRLFSLYGPNDNHKWFVHYLIDKLLHDEEIDMTLGEQKLDYLYIEDAVDALEKIIDIKSGLGIANFASGISITLKDFVLMAQKIFSSKSKINFGKIPYRNDQVMNMRTDVSKLTSTLDWNPRCSYEYGITKIIESYIEIK
jgi:nucleoside-diphosphate-sugar epimerase